MHENLTKIFNNKTLSFVVFLILAASLTWNTVKVIQRNFELQQQVNKLVGEVELLKLQNQNTKYEIEYFKSDVYLELAAREKFQKARAGEKVINLPKDTTVELADTAQADTEEDDSSNFDKWMSFLFNREQ